ncbi:hypothetical protein GQ53DRAFT_657886 [Thozetella sp. PMI_491]|nr:hypothetical protein GQ53DRAFT_657886 [Thozetella sp. PMI_491]
MDLNTYNMTKIFTENAELMIDSPAAERFWDDVLNNHGIVSVPTSWALSLGFSPTLPHPDVEGYSVYQVDVFHSLHCLDRIRNQLVSNKSQDLWPFGDIPDPDKPDIHTLHCINFLRQQLTCHADIMLQGTDDFLHYAKNSGHQCRDYDAIMNWVNKHNWIGHHSWLTYHYSNSQS